MNIYKKDIIRYNKQLADRKKRGWMLIKITTVLLAVSIFTTAVGCAVSLAMPDQPKDTENSGGVDKTPPVIKAKDSNAVIYIGDTVSYRSFVVVTDNGEGTCKISVDSSNVKLDTTGTYTVIYTAEDSAGNKSKPFKLTVSVKDGTYNEKALMELVAKKAKSALGYTKEEAKSSGKTKVQIVRDIYNYINSPDKGKYEANILFNDAKSNAVNQLKQNGQQSREGWKVDWVEEAHRTLSMTRMEGDCYTYYAVSKAFFEYFEIENCGIQRNTTKSELSGTHYWNIVKADSGWYYFDATRLAGTFADGSRNACLITESKLQGYKTSGGSPYFYKMNKTDPNFFDADDNGGKFPEISTKAVK